jgi:Protein of unknown function (DUF1242)
MSALFDFPSLLIVVLLIICTATFARSLRKNIFTNSTDQKFQHSGLNGVAWKAARIGERMSPWVAASCIAAAFFILFVR